MEPSLYALYQRTNRLLVHSVAIVVLITISMFVCLRGCEISAEKFSDCVRITQKPLECRAGTQ